jgi:hypothetical protein
MSNKKIFNFTACWLEFDIIPGNEPPCIARLGFKSNKAPFNSAGELMITDCQHVPDGIEKFYEVIKELNMEIDKDFSLIYPIYKVDDELESFMHEVAWIIKEYADKNNWGFAREIPNLVFD